MIIMVYWGDDEQSEKARRAERLKKKKQGETFIEPPVSQLNDTEMMELLRKQSEQLGQLQDFLILQQKVLKELKEESKKTKEVHIIEKVIASEDAQITIAENKKLILPELNEDLGSDLIDKSGIEVSGGEIGHNKSDGLNISDRIKRLKELKDKNGGK